MATTTATIDVSVNGLDKLNKLQGSIDFVQRKFLSLRSAIAGIGLAALGQSALALADDLQDLSNSSGIATARLLELKKALTTSGGQADQLAQGVNTFLRSIDEAAQGSLKAQASFENLGISLNDLRTTSEQGLLLKTLDSIAAIEDPSRRAAIMMDKFGKSFRTVDPGELAAKIRSSAGTMDQYANTIARAAELNDQLATAQGTLKLAFLEAFSPIIGIINQFNSATEEGKGKIEFLINAFKALGVVISVLFAFTAWGAIVRIIGTIGRGVAAASGAFSGLTASFGTFGTATAAVFRANGPLMTGLRGVGGLVAGLIAGIGTYLGLTEKTVDLKPGQQALPPGVKPSEAGAGRGGKGGPTADELKAYDEQKNKVNQLRDVEETARNNARRGIREITDDFTKQNKLTQDRLRLESSLVGKTEEEKQIKQALFDLEQQYNNTKDQLIKKQQSLTDEEKFLIPVIKEQLRELDKKYAADQKGLTTIITGLQTANLLERERQQILEQITKQMESQARFGELLVNANDKLQDVKFESSLSGLTETQKQLARIQEEARKGALEAGRAIASQYEGQDLSASQSETLAKRLEEVGQKYKQIADLQTANALKARTFTSGWTDALNSFLDNTSNAADAAKNIFGNMTKGMEDLFVNFAKTGKFEWRGFVASLAEELLRSQLKQLIGSLFGGASAQGGGGGILGTLISGVGSLLGFANGGMIPTNRPVLVGERGPEIITGAGGRTVIPNDALGGGSQYVTYNINAVDAMSFKQMLARDPAFIHAVAEKGRSTIATRR